VTVTCNPFSSPMSGNPDEIHRVHETVAEIFSYAVRLGGTVSGEHGIGLTKKRFLPSAIGEINLWVIRCAGYGSFGVGLSDLLMNGANRSIGIGRMVVVLCSLEISFIVCKKRSCRAIGCAEIIDAACTSFSAA
jgi:hypothetical protein